MLPSQNPFRGALALTLVMTAGLAAAQPADLARCRALADAAARLACYDALAGPAVAGPAARPTAAAPVLPALPAAQAAAPPPAVSSAAPSTFGLDRPAAEAERSVSSQIAGVFEGWGPSTRIRLANGQVWQVADGSSADLYLREPRVTVRRGMLGGYVLELEGSNRTARVRRVE